MKRILFYSENFCGPKVKGGLEVATYRIAKALHDKCKYEVFAAFRSKTFDGDRSVYTDVISLKKAPGRFQKDLARFIKQNEIDIVVNMSRFYRHNKIVEAIKESGRDIKVVFMQHFAPGSEIKKAKWSSGYHLLKLNPFNPLYWLRSSIYPLLKLPRRLAFSKVYKDTYEKSDRVVLLSEGYIEDYCKIAGLSETDKFRSIPNIYEREDREDNSAKTMKRVLVLSRMDEIQKRISLALRVWAEIEKDLDLSDWHLDIVGSGHNSDIVRRLVKKLKLKNVTLHGWQPRDKFLKESSILISTSEYEGEPLSIIEAQAHGVVPIAFNSYASLKDVVSHYENGVVVENFGDIEDFVLKLKDLMYDDDYRKEFSDNAISNVSKFSSENIVKKWDEMLLNL